MILTMENNAHFNQKIFIVDDDMMTAALYEQSLLNLGYTDVSTFRDAPSALNQLTQEPNIILLDQNMEEMSGLVALKKIKRFDPNAYVVFVSGQDDIATAVTSLKHGAFDYIVKGDGDIDSIEQVLQKIKNVQEMLQRNKGGLVRRVLSILV